MSLPHPPAPPNEPSYVAQEKLVILYWDIDKLQWEVGQQFNVRQHAQAEEALGRYRKELGSTRVVLLHTSDTCV